MSGWSKPKIEVYKVWTEFTDPAAASNISAKGYRHAIRLFFKREKSRSLSGIKGEIIEINVSKYLMTPDNTKCYAVWIGERGGIYRIGKLF